ncbi:MAG: NAD(P)/FAD-dependent oxidoreductase [Syntrophales bacterium]|nr:NAD(P)/FAD-dependent oxidoreductase [Syntrophales bacterium]
MINDPSPSGERGFSEPANAEPPIIVVGAGPAGMMAAGQAASRGAGVLLVEAMDRPGRKLRITGKGRCNITNDRPMDEFLRRFGLGGRFLKHCLHDFFAPDLRAFLASLGVETVTERGNRVFPSGNRAEEVVDALTDWTEQQSVIIKTSVRALEVIVKAGRIRGLRVKNMVTGKEDNLHAHALVIATGGMSYPLTGSTGDGYRLARHAGHSIVPLRPALVPLETEGDRARRLQGLSLRNVRASLRIAGKKGGSEFGEMLFTHFGVSGPIILTLSGRAVDALQDGKGVELSIDLKPALDEDKLDARLLRDFETHGKMRFRNLLKGLLPPLMVPICLEMTGISADKQGSQVAANDRRRLRSWLKDFRLSVKGHRPIDEAIITAGGVDLKEVNPKTMESRIVKGLFFAGEVLDIDADTGGYNLQAAFSTGCLAGRSAAAYVMRD